MKTVLICLVVAIALFLLWPTSEYEDSFCPSNAKCAAPPKHLQLGGGYRRIKAVLQ